MPGVKSSYAVALVKWKKNATRETEITHDQQA